MPKYSSRSRSKSPPASGNRHNYHRDSGSVSARPEDDKDYHKKKKSHKSGTSSSHHKHHQSSSKDHKSSKHHHHKSSHRHHRSPSSQDSKDDPYQDRYHGGSGSGSHRRHRGRDDKRDRSSSNDKYHHASDTKTASSRYNKDKGMYGSGDPASKNRFSSGGFSSNLEQLTQPQYQQQSTKPVVDPLEQLTRKDDNINQEFSQPQNVKNMSAISDNPEVQYKNPENYRMNANQDQIQDQGQPEPKKSRVSRFSFAPKPQTNDDMQTQEISDHQQPPNFNQDAQIADNLAQNKAVEAVKSVLQPENEWDKITADREYIYIPGQDPVLRKRKNKWTDAQDEEIKEAFFKDKNTEIDTSQANPALMIGQNPELLQNLNPAILNALQDSSKIKKKVYIPINTGVNYIGLLIGPRGLYQKRLEEESGCKILIRGKGSQKQGAAPQPDDEDEQHVLIIGDNPEQVRRAQTAIERVIGADDNTREKIRTEQLVVAQQLNNSQVQAQPMDESMMTPYGAPSPYAYIIPVPNDSVGLIIGKNGETIRRLQMDSGAKIQVAKMEIQDTNVRNVFVEGSHEKYLLAKEAIEQIIQDHKRQTSPQIRIGDSNPFGKPLVSVKVLDRFVGLIIGKQGETLKGVATRTGTKIFVPQKNPDVTSDTRTVEISAESLESCQEAEVEINNLITLYQNQSQNNRQMNQNIGMGQNQYDNQQKNQYGGDDAQGYNQHQRGGNNHHHGQHQRQNHHHNSHHNRQNNNHNNDDGMNLYKQESSSSHHSGNNYNNNYHKSHHNSSSHNQQYQSNYGHNQQRQSHNASHQDQNNSQSYAQMYQQSQSSAQNQLANNASIAYASMQYSNSYSGYDYNQDQDSYQNPPAPAVSSSSAAAAAASTSTNKDAQESNPANAPTSAAAGDSSQTPQTQNQDDDQSQTASTSAAAAAAAYQNYYPQYYQNQSSSHHHHHQSYGQQSDSTSQQQTDYAQQQQQQYANYYDNQQNPQQQQYDAYYAAQYYQQQGYPNQQSYYGNNGNYQQPDQTQNPASDQQPSTENQTNLGKTGGDQDQENGATGGQAH